jgi:DNA-binding LacI/PurR family transcriptional regulator
MPDAGPRARVTPIRNIKELADLAGVTPATVSRALADSELISRKTRERIKAIALEHGFRPNAMARNLRFRKTGAIGVVIPLDHEAGQHISDPLFMTMLCLLADALAERGYNLLLSRVMPSNPDWLDRFIDSGRVDGVIVIGQSDQSEVLDRVAAKYRPLVVWGGHSPGQVHCSVGSDNRLGGDLAASHLIERGSESLAFIGDPRELEIGQRLEGCRGAMARAGLKDKLTILPASLAAEAARPGIADFVGSGQALPQGIVAASDAVAMSTLSVLFEAGLSVPGDVRVIGYDGLALSEISVPRLSTIRQDLNGGAAHLVDLLLRRIAGEETGPVVMKPELVVRMSS